MSLETPALHDYMTEPPDLSNPFHDLAMILYREGQYKKLIDSSTSHDLWEKLFDFRSERDQAELEFYLWKKVVAYADAKTSRVGRGRCINISTCYFEKAFSKIS